MQSNLSATGVPALASASKMASDYGSTSDSTTPLPADAAFNLRLTLLGVDQNGNPTTPVGNSGASGSSTPERYFDIWCPDAGADAQPGCVIVSMLGSDLEEHYYLLSADPSKPIRFPVDRGGICSLKVYGDFSIPPLSVSGSTFPSIDGHPTSFSIDLGADNCRYLKQVNSDAINRAVAYSGTPMLNPSYSSSSDKIAEAVNSLIANSALSQLCDHQLMPAGTRKSAIRPTSSPSEFTVLISDAEVQFQPGVSAELSLEGSVFSEFSHYVRNVVYGTEKITKIIAKDVKGDFQYLICSAERMWTLTLDDVRHAVVGFLKQVVNDVREIEQWLSFVFDWEQIVENANAISGRITSQLQSLKNFLDKEADQVLAAIGKQFESGTIQRNFSEAVNNNGNNLASSYYPACQGVNGNTPFTNYGQPAGQYAYSGDFTSASNWLPQRASLDDLLPSGAAAAKLGVWNDAGAELTDAFDALKDACKAILDLIPNCQEILATGLKDLFGDGSTSDPTEFVSHSISDFLNVVESLQEIVASAVIEVSNDVLTAFCEVLQAAYDFLTSQVLNPDSTVGQLFDNVFDKLFKFELTPVNLISLTLAVPATLIGEVANLKPPSGSAETVVSDAANAIGEIMKIAGLACDAFLLPFDMGDDLGQEFPPPMNLLVGLTSCANSLLSMPIFDDELPALEWAVWTFQLPPSIYGLVTTFAPVGIQVAAPFYSVYGGFMIVVHTVMAIETKEKALEIAHDILSDLPYLGKSLVYFDDVAPSVGTGLVCTVDCVGSAAAFVTGTVSELTS